MEGLFKEKCHLIACLGSTTKSGRCTNTLLPYSQDRGRTHAPGRILTGLEVGQFLSVLSRIDVSVTVSFAVQLARPRTSSCHLKLRFVKHLNSFTGSFLI